MKVAVIMGSASDLEVMTPALTTLEQFGIPFDKRVLSAHRNPGPLAEYVGSLAGAGAFTLVDSLSGTL